MTRKLQDSETVASSSKAKNHAVVMCCSWIVHELSIRITPDYDGTSACLFGGFFEVNLCPAQGIIQNIEPYVRSVERCKPEAVGGE